MTELPQRSQLLAQFGGVPRILERVVGGFLKATPDHLDGIEQALRKGDAELLSTKAHSYKGSLGYFSQGQLYKLVKQMEELGRQGRLSDANTIYPEVREKSLLLSTHLASLVSRS